ncbi:hypothetical protein HMSSN036_79970 [Paenibacillus macerans]|nr:hypothetical protein HMSSN036_79970 [Paenibacillus macerans]
MLHRFKGLALLSLSCVLAWTGWTGTSQAAASLSEKALEAEVEWSREYGESYASPQGRSVVPTADGGYAAVGSAEFNGDEAGYVVKVDEEGAVEWEQRLQITGDYTKDSVEARQIIQTQDGGYLVTGAITDRTGRPITLPYLAKLDGQGEIEWARYYKDLYIGTHLYAGSVAETPDGGFAVTGYSVNSYWEAPAYLLKVDNEGNQLWFKTYRFGEGNNQVFNEVITAPDGGLLAVGYIDSVINSDADASVIVKVDAQGEVEWEQKQPAPQTGRAAYSAQLSADGGYIVYGLMYPNDERTAFLLKADADGNIVWGEKLFSPRRQRLLQTISDHKGRIRAFRQFDPQGRFEVSIPDLLHQPGWRADRQTAICGSGTCRRRKRILHSGRRLHPVGPSEGRGKIPHAVG